MEKQESEKGEVEDKKEEVVPSLSKKGSVQPFMHPTKQSKRTPKPTQEYEIFKSQQLHNKRLKKLNDKEKEVKKQQMKEKEKKKVENSTPKEVKQMEDLNEEED